jgi:MFS family permease
MRCLPTEMRASACGCSISPSLSMEFVTEAPPSLRNTAQGLYTFVTYGIGMFVGSLLSGGAVDFFTTTVGSQPVRHWTGFWMSSSLGALALLLVFAVFFRTRRMVGKRESPALVEVG